MVAHWVQSSKSGVTLKEKTLLLTKMNQNYENHFPNDTELMASFLKIILHVYTDSVLQAELGSKLESAFMTGLRFVKQFLFFFIAFILFFRARVLFPLMK